MKSEQFTPESLMKALRTKKTECILIPGGIPYPTKHGASVFYQVFRPLYDIGDIFLHFHQGGAIRNVNWKAVLIWVVFLQFGFGFLEIILRLII